MYNCECLKNIWAMKIAPGVASKLFFASLWSWLYQTQQWANKIDWKWEYYCRILLCGDTIESL